MKVYEQVYSFYVKQIEDGSLKTGDRMPSIRESERTLNVSRTSIETAYLQLAADGYIYSVEKVGYFVSDMVLRIENENNQVISGNKKESKEYTYDLAVIGEDKTVSCLQLWRRYMKSALRQEERLLNYPNNQGEEDLRQEIAAYVRKTRNIICSADDIVIGAGFQSLLSLLISALGVVISVFTLFILLSARQALVVVLTVVSPVAIVCFMLPNTKKIFDRWLKISEGMLLVYPICGLLVGGGDYVSRLLLTLANQGGFFIVLTAMIVGIVPIFFIPTVLKKSFAAAGDIGAKISGYGQKVRGGAQSSVRNSEAYKRAQTRMNAGINRKGDMTAGGKLRTNLAKSRLNPLLLK